MHGACVDAIAQRAVVESEVRWRVILRLCESSRKEHLIPMLVIHTKVIARAGAHGKQVMSC